MGKTVLKSKKNGNKHEQNKASRARMSTLMRCAKECDDFGVLTQEGHYEGEGKRKAVLVAMSHRDAVRNFKMALSLYGDKGVIGFAIYFKNVKHSR